MITLVHLSCENKKHPIYCHFAGCRTQVQVIGGICNEMLRPHFDTKLSMMKSVHAIYGTKGSFKSSKSTQWHLLYHKSCFCLVKYVFSSFLPRLIFLHRLHNQTVQLISILKQHSKVTPFCYRYCPKMTIKYPRVANSA